MLTYLVILKCTLAAGMCIAQIPDSMSADNITLANDCTAIPAAQDDNVPAQQCTINFDNGTIIVKDSDRANDKFYINILVQEDDSKDQSH